MRSDRFPPLLTHRPRRRGPRRGRRHCLRRVPSGQRVHVDGRRGAACARPALARRGAPAPRGAAGWPRTSPTRPASTRTPSPPSSSARDSRPPSFGRGPISSTSTSPMPAVTAWCASAWPSSTTPPPRGRPPQGHPGPRARLLGRPPVQPRRPRPHRRRGPDPRVRGETKLACWGRAHRRGERRRLRHPRRIHGVLATGQSKSARPGAGARQLERGATTPCRELAFPTRLSVNAAPMYLKCGRTFISTL